MYGTESLGFRRGNEPSMPRTAAHQASGLSPANRPRSCCARGGACPSAGLLTSSKVTLRAAGSAWHKETCVLEGSEQLTAASRVGGLLLLGTWGDRAWFRANQLPAVCPRVGSRSCRPPQCARARQRQRWRPTGPKEKGTGASHHLHRPTACLRAVRAGRLLTRQRRHAHGRHIGTTHAAAAAVPLHTAGPGAWAGNKQV